MSSFFIVVTYVHYLSIPMCHCLSEYTYCLCIYVSMSVYIFVSVETQLSVLYMMLEY